MFPNLQGRYFTMDFNFIGNTKAKAAPYIGAAIIETRAVSAPQNSRSIFLEKCSISKGLMTTFIVIWSVYGHNEDEKTKLQRTHNGLERYNRILNEKFAGKQSLLSFIKILEEESKQKVRQLEDVRTGNVVNITNQNFVGDKIDNERELKVLDFYY